MTTSPPSKEEFQILATLLEQRLDVIADHAFRDRDPDAHLEALKSVSEEILAWHTRHHDQLPPRLEHFLAGSSYQKAQAYVQSLLKDQ
ncbi:MAG: hypothetical protein AAF591_16765 [Verrucomicrobiota bacterium]